MTFVPSFNYNSTKINKEFVLSRDCSAMKGTILKGSKVIIINVGSRGYDILDIESGEVMTECGFDCIVSDNK